MRKNMSTEQPQSQTKGHRSPLNWPLVRFQKISPVPGELSGQYCWENYRKYQFLYRLSRKEAVAHQHPANQKHKSSA